MRVGANVRLLTDLGYVQQRDGIVCVWLDEAARRQQPPLVLRLIQVQNEHGTMSLVTSVLSERKLSNAKVARLYSMRWGIETFFKLLKSHGQQLEQWQQQNGAAVARRILVASMACVVVWSLQHDDSTEAAATKKILVRLSGRQMKYGDISTAPALLAGYMNLLAINDLLTETETPSPRRNAVCFCC